MAQEAQAQSERRARVAEEVHWARVRAAMAAVALRKEVATVCSAGGGESGEGGRRQRHRCD